MDKVAEYLLNKGDIGLLILGLVFLTWLLWRQQSNLTKIVETNTSAHVSTAHAIDKMATEIGASVKQNSEFQRSVLEVFTRNISK